MANFIQTLQAKVEAQEREIVRLRREMQAFYTYLAVSPKFREQSDGSRGDWIATGDVMRWINQTVYTNE